MAVYKTVPNQKVVKVNKEKCDKDNLYATINIDAMEQAAQKLDAGAFKLWMYFAKNQNNFEFALSSKDVLETFGIKAKQYNNAVEELITKGYLVAEGGNKYTFNEIAVMPKGNNESSVSNSLMPKGHNDVIPKGHNVVIPKGNNVLCPLDIRNNTNTTLDNTIDNTEGIDKTASLRSAVVINSTAELAGAEKEQVQVLTTKEALSKYGLTACANRVKAGYNNCYWISGELVKLV